MFNIYQLSYVHFKRPEIAYVDVNISYLKS
jgi:hypothetical protein